MRKKRETEEEKIRRRMDTYGCDGKCYTGYEVCPCVETCEETRRGEFAALIFASFMTVILFVTFGLSTTIFLLRVIMRLILDLKDYLVGLL